MDCSRCGSIIPDGSDTCEYCGNKVQRQQNDGASAYKIDLSFIEGMLKQVSALTGAADASKTADTNKSSTDTNPNKIDLGFNPEDLLKQVSSLTNAANTATNATATARETKQTAKDIKRTAKSARRTLKSVRMLIILVAVLAVIVTAVSILVPLLMRSKGLQNASGGETTNCIVIEAFLNNPATINIPFN